MPLIFRAMKRADDGYPLVGSRSRELGVRVPPDPHADIDVRSDGVVEQNGRGMSVAEHWMQLLPHLVPKRLSALYPGAAGSNALACYRMGEGQFTAGAISSELMLDLKPGRRSNGNVTPAKPVPVAEFQRALAATRDEWTVDEGPQ